MVVFVLLFATAAYFARGAASRLAGGGFDDPQSESYLANEALRARFGLGTPDVVVAYTHKTLKVEDLEFARLLGPALAKIRSIEGVKHVSSPYDENPEAVISKDGKTVVIPLRFKSKTSAEHLYDDIVAKVHVPGLDVLLGGAVPAARQAQEAARQDLVRSELVTLPLVAILLVVFFRGLILASLPILIGGFSVATALAGIRMLTHVTEVSIFAMNIVTFIGLGVAIDYSLFMTSRFRHELDAGVSVEKAVLHTLNTAGRTIAYSGGAVAVSLMALYVFPLGVLRSVAIAGSLVVLMSLVGSLLFLPAILALLGHRIDWLSFGKKRATTRKPWFWRSVATPSMKYPIVVTLAVTGLLLLLGEPFLHINAAVSGAMVLPEEAEARKLAELLESDAFPKNATTPIEIAITTRDPVLSPEGLKELEAYVTALEKMPHIVRVGAIVGQTSGYTASDFSDLLAGQYGDTVRMRVEPYVRGRDTSARAFLDVPALSEEAQEAIRNVRKLQVGGVQTLATSPAGRLLDLTHTLGSHVPPALLLVCVATFVVLFLAFGSVVMPIKAIIMNVLSLTASFGALVWIFQEGRFETLLGYRSPGNIELTIPVMMFAVVFGLAMDYELFLLSHIREVYDRTKDNAASVTIGLERSGRIITQAAALLVAVMIGFVSADMLLVKEMGVGMAIAVIVDATIVRSLLVPATMQLMGHYNWWAPAPLARLWKRLDLGVDEREADDLTKEELEGEPTG
jgi:uncharacterized membrane protein YdfJ with MMPL/SSD domain